MRSLCYVTFLAILSINVHFCACLRLLAETPLPVVIPNGQPGAPAPLPPVNIPPNVSVNIPANLPANIPVNLPANVPPEMLANLPGNVSPEMLSNVPLEVLANLSANVSPDTLANMPPEMVVNLPADVQSQLPPNVPPAKLVADLAAAGNHPGEGVAAAAGLPQMPKMPDFSGLTDLSFPPMPAARMPSMPRNITLFGFEVQIPKFINKMVDDETGGS